MSALLQSIRLGLLKTLTGVLWGHRSQITLKKTLRFLIRWTRDTSITKACWPPRLVLQLKTQIRSFTATRKRAKKQPGGAIQKASMKPTQVQKLVVIKETPLQYRLTSTETIVTWDRFRGKNWMFKTRARAIICAPQNGLRLISECPRFWVKIRISRWANVGLISAMRGLLYARLNPM